MLDSEDAMTFQRTMGLRSILFLDMGSIYVLITSKYRTVDALPIFSLIILANQTSYLLETIKLIT